jgi:hypothetical protein
MERGRYVASNFNTLTLNVATTGSANPADPIGDAAGSGDAFDSLYSLIQWANNRVSAAIATINIAAGNYPNDLGGGVSFVTGILNLAGSAAGSTHHTNTVLDLRAVKQVSVTGKITIATLASNNMIARFDYLSLEGSSSDFILTSPHTGALAYPVVDAHVVRINANNKLTVSVPGGTGSFVLRAIDEFDNKGTLTLTRGGVSPVAMFQGTVSLLGVIDTPGSAKKCAIDISAAQMRNPSATLKNGAKITIVGAITTKPGYIVEPRTRVMYTWGVTVGNGNPTRVTFPLAFTGVPVVMVTPAGGKYGVTAVTDSTTKTGFNVYQLNQGNPGSPSGLPTTWFAIGR